MSFSLDVQPAREDAWDRGAIARGFWACPDFGWRRSRVRTRRRPVDCACTWNDAGGGIRADFLFRDVEGIAAYCDHPVRFGVVESINTTIKAVLRRARGMKDEQMRLLKLKWATAHPIRSTRDMARFLSVQPVYSNR